MEQWFRNKWFCYISFVNWWTYKTICGFKKIGCKEWLGEISGKQHWIWRVYWGDVLGNGNGHHLFKRIVCPRWMLGGTNWAPWIARGKIFGETTREKLVIALGGMLGKTKKSSSFTKQNTFLHFGHIWCIGREGQKKHLTKHIIGFGYNECEFTIFPN